MEIRWIGSLALGLLLCAGFCLPARGQSLAVPPGEAVADEMGDLDDVPEAAPRAAITEFPLPTPEPASTAAPGHEGAEPATAK